MNPAGQLQTLLAQALAHHQAGRLAAALPLYRQAQRIGPASFDAWNLGGTASLQAGAAEEARAQLARAVQLKPDSGVALLRLGSACAALGRLDEAADLLRRAALKSPKAPEPFEHLAVVERRRGRMAEAVQAAQAACALRPDSPEAFFRVCHLVSAARGISAALPLLEDAARRWPDNAEAWKFLGTAQANLHRAADALASLERAAAIRADLPGLDLGLGLARQESGRIAEAVEAYERVLRADPAHAEAGSARLLCLNYLDEASPARIAAAARSYGEARPRRSPWTPPPPRDPSRPPRVAIVSPDLRRHAVAQFFEPILAHLPTGELDVWLYHDHPTEDATSERLKNLAARWTNIAGLPHEQVRDRLRADAPDILVDLAAHTGFNRLPVFAERVAPVEGRQEIWEKGKSGPTKPY